MHDFSLSKGSCKTLEEAIIKVQELTREIASDGKITGPELDNLITWLNKNHDYKDQWPFRLLYKFIFEALEDGVFSEKEEKDFINLIGEIQIAPIFNNESSNKALNDCAKNVDEFPNDDIPNESIQDNKIINEKKPSLFGRIFTFFFPGPGQIISIQSFSDPGLSYQVDVDRKTCNCPDFVNSRRGFPEKDLRRLCKHLVLGLVEAEKLNNYSKTVQEFIKLKNAEGRGVNLIEEFYEINLSVGGTILLSKSATSPWVNVCANPRKIAKGYPEIQRFGYNIEEGRWSYRISPKNQKEIENQIAKHW